MPGGLGNGGYVRYRLGVYDRAVADLERAARLAPRNPHVLRYLGLALAAKGQTRRALAQLDAAIRVEPKTSVAVRLDRARLRGEQGDAEGALSDLDEAVRTAPRLRASRGPGRLPCRRRSVGPALDD